MSRITMLGGTGFGIASSRGWSKKALDGRMKDRLGFCERSERCQRKPNTSSRPRNPCRSSRLSSTASTSALLSTSTAVSSALALKPISRLSSLSTVWMWVASVLLLSVIGESARVHQEAESLEPWPWHECRISDEDRWGMTSSRSPKMLMQGEYARHYSCVAPKGAKLAAKYRFRSECTRQSFDLYSAHQCLKGRRLIFLGDSLATQQADSMVWMLGWHVHFLRADDPQSIKIVVNDKGKRVYSLLECYRQKVDPAPRCERCYDLFGHQLRPDPPHANLDHLSPDDKAALLAEVKNRGRGVDEVREDDYGDHVGTLGVRRNLRGDDSQQWTNSHTAGAEWRTGENRTVGLWGSLGLSRGETGVVTGGVDDGNTSEDRRLMRDEGMTERLSDERDEVSIHMRHFPTSGPGDPRWFQRVVKDFNETRPSDVFVVNFGAHYHDTPEMEAEFRAEIAPVLDAMGELGDKATVVWREMSPTHFPAVNGSFDDFNMLPNSKKKNVCCTGIPPIVDPRNKWVEEYLTEKGLRDRVKILRIYNMSRMRAAAHHTCHLASPSYPASVGSEPAGLCPRTGQIADCRHWSEPGVVEDWNELLLNHLCPVHDYL